MTHRLHIPGSALDGKPCQPALRKIDDSPEFWRVQVDGYVSTMLFRSEEIVKQ